VLKEGKVYILKDKKLRVKIIWLHYDVPAIGYCYDLVILELVKEQNFVLEKHKRIQLSSKYKLVYLIYSRL